MIQSITEVPGAIRVIALPVIYLVSWQEPSLDVTPCATKRQVDINNWFPINISLIYKSVPIRLF